MPYKSIFLLSLFISLLIPALHAQPNPYGLPRIQNYHFSETGGSEQNWCITQDFRGLIYVGNHDKGVLEYDGSNWHTIPVPGNVPVRSMVAGDDNYIYVGLEGDFGRLEPDETGELHYRSLSDSTIMNKYPDVSIWKSYFQDGLVYFCGFQAIFTYDPAQNRLEVIETTEYAFFSFFRDQKLFLGDYALGLMMYDGQQFTEVPGGSFFRERSISGLVSFDSTRLLISVISQGLFLLDLENGQIDSTFTAADLKEDFSDKEVINLQIRSERIFVATLRGGMYILDLQGNLTEVFSENQGLLDNSHVGVYLTPPGQAIPQIWIAHYKGLSRVDMNSPFRSFSIGMGRPGMGGRNQGELITDIIRFNGRSFVSSLGGIHRWSDNPERPGLRPLRGIRESIYDLEVLRPSPGMEFLLASGENQTYVIDRNMEFIRLGRGGRKLVRDPDFPSVFYVGGYSVSGFHYELGQWKEEKIVDDLRRPIMHLCLDKYSYLWISTPIELHRVDLMDGDKSQIRIFSLDKGLPEAQYIPLFAEPESRELLAGTDKGFYRYDYYRDTFLYDSLYNSILPEGKNQIMTLHRGVDDLYWFSFENESRGWSILGARRDSQAFELVYDRPFRSLSPAASTDVFYTDENQQHWFSKSNQFFHFNPSNIPEKQDTFRILMRRVIIQGDSLLFQGTHFKTDPTGRLQSLSEQEEDALPRIDYQYRNMEFRWAAPFFSNERHIRYSYCLEGFSSGWSEWSRSRSAKYTNLSHGKYVMQVKAMNVFGEESPPASYAFSILRPWYATFIAISLYIILSISLAVFVLLYTRNLKHRAELLQRQNREIELQKKELENLNEEITAQRDEIEAQRDSITTQNELIGQQKNAMTDSIRYARRIQDAVLPAKEVMRYLLPKHFVFYRPRDIVSGDFFWVDKKDETIWLAVADCTGHGVPGAFMSMLGISLLNEISGQYSGQPTNEIMDELRDQVIASLGQTGDRYEAKDGLEMGLVAINPKTREIQFTGAMHNLFTFRKGELEVIKGDRMPVGIHSEGNTLFTSHSMKLERGDTLYMFSDGYADQFGGKDRKKYGSSRLKVLLTQLQKNIMHDQKEAIKKEFEQWKGKQEQIDDVLMIGIKL